ncbi:MAG: hypothetical protein LIO76_09870 [Clostridiales bacterium]|nr:hypothetical protein [Clostridiales bacterium]
MLYALYNPQRADGSNTKAADWIPGWDTSGAVGAAPDMDLSSACDMFRITVERMRHVQGEWRSVTATLFPDYLFLNCEEAVALEVKERLEEEWNARLVGSPRQCLKQQLPLIPIPEELSELLSDLCDTEHHIPMSKGVLRNGLAHVTEGPLTGHDNRIVRIDRHKRLAWLKVSEEMPSSFAKDSTNVLIAGLEITEKL